ncbi:MAG TPA: MarR family transcriptional regulator [Candidatus Marinimicrobia bacterium]|nr:MarR family transcriptional regulator [Candidatus Neomarinimicrobiota bacterium]
MEFGELLKLFLLDLQRLFRSKIVDGELTLSQILLISCIPDESIDMTSLAQQIGVDNSTLTRLVDVLLRRDWVFKTKDTIDKRITLLGLTQKGEEIQNKIEDRIDYYGDMVYESIAVEDRDEVKEILSSFHWTLSKMLMKHE